MISDVLAEAKEKMDKAVEAAKDDFGTVRTVAKSSLAASTALSIFSFASANTSLIMY